VFVTGAEDDGTKIPLHMIILGAVGGVILTSVTLGLCIMCRSRRKHARKTKEEQKLRQTQQRGQHMEMGTPTSHHPSHTLSRHGDDGGRGRQSQKGQGQGQQQGRYMTFAKDNPNRYSFGSGAPLPDPNIGGDLNDLDQSTYRRYLTLEVNPDDLDFDLDHTHGNMYTATSTPQGVVIGMTHLPPGTTTTSIPSPTTQIPHSQVEGGGGVPHYGKYAQQGMLPGWPRTMLEDPTLVYPYSSSLPRPTPFLGLSKPILSESKYLKTMQALKSMDEEIMKETPTS